LSDKQFEHFMNQTDDFIEEHKDLVRFTPAQEETLNKRLSK